MHVNLRGSEADAVGLVHGFQHVVDQLANARIDGFDRLGHRVQARIGIAEDVQTCHW